MNTLKRNWFIGLLLVSTLTFAQVGTWRNIPTLTEIRSLTPLDNVIILASNGGLLSFDKSSQLFQGGIQGMQATNLDVNKTYIDGDSVLWIGARSPGPILEAIDLIDGKKLNVEFVDLDEITSFVQVGDSVYATYLDGLEGGLLLYRKGVNKIEYLDQFNNFDKQSTLGLNTSQDALAIDDKILFRTDKYILWAEVNGTNLKDPANWQMSAIPNGVPKITRMIAAIGGPLVSAGTKLYRYDYTQFVEVYDADKDILDIQQQGNNPDLLVFAASDGIYTYNLVSTELIQLVNVLGITSISSIQNEVWAGSSRDFLAVWDGSEFRPYSANRPRDHFFNRMILNENRQLVGGAYNGISIHSDDGWRTIIPGNIAGHFDDALYDWNSMITDTLVYIGRTVVEDLIRDKMGNLYLSLQGRGVLKLDKDQRGNSEYFNASNGVMEPTYDSHNYILPGQMAVDSRNNVWLTNKFIRDSRSSMTIIGADSGVYHIDQYQAGMNSRTVKSIAIDQNDFVWIGSQVWPDLQAVGGIHFIKHTGVGENMELSVSFLSGGSLGNNEILQLEVDAQNTLWILTPSGVQSMPLPDRWLTSLELRNWANIYMTPKDYYWQLTDYNVTGIEIDQRGNRWFLSPNAGVHVFEQNGRWINEGYGYSTSNSGLLDDAVYSIAFDPESGETYFSTPKGISVLNTPFADPKENYSDVHIYPHPFNPDIHEKVIIQGLMDNSSIKILTITGVLVRELSSENNEVHGYEAHWDGLDSRGGKVGSGVYLLYIFNEDGVATKQKLAILR